MNKIFYFFLLTTSFVIAEDTTKMLQKAQKYCEKHPDTWEGHYNLGCMHYQNSDLGKAEESFSKAIQCCKQPEHQESILYNLGNTYFREAEAVSEDQQRIPLLEKSVQNYEGAAALNKDAEDTQHNLATAKKWLERLKKKQEQQKDQKQNEQDRKKENNKENDKDKSKENKNEQQKEEQQQQKPQSMKQKEMQNVLQKEQNNERILPINFNNNSNLPEDKVLKDW